MKKYLIKIIFFSLVVVIVYNLFSANKINFTQRGLSLAIDNEITTFNYLRTTNTNDIQQINQVMEGLLTYDKDNKLIGAGAEKWEELDNGRKYRFVLRRNSFWSDGTPVLADDYIFSWSENLLNKKSLYPFILFPILNAEKIYKGEKEIKDLGVYKINDYELEVVLEYPYNSFLYGLANCSTFPIKQEFYEAVGSENFGTTSGNILYNGAYVIDYADFSSEIIYKINKNYWDSINTSIKNINCKIIKDPNTQRMLFDNNDIGICKINEDNYIRYSSETSTSYNIVSGLSNKIVYLYISGDTKQNNIYFRDLIFRKSISKCIDRDKLIKDILQDNSIALNRLIPNYKTPLNENYYDLVNLPDNFAYDVKEAQSLWSYILTKYNISSLTLPIYYPKTDINQKILENIKQQLEMNLLGLSVELTPVAFRGYGSYLKNEGIACGIQTWTGTFPNPESFLQIFDKNSYFNYANYNDSDFQNKYDTAKNIYDLKTQYFVFGDAEKIASDSYSINPLFVLSDNYILKSNIRGFQYKATLPNFSYKDIQIV